MRMDSAQELVNQLDQELRRGTLVPSVLSRLSSPQYGYSLVQELGERGVGVDASTLYPLLRRLEKQGLCEASWETGGAKPRKYYLRTALGDEVYGVLSQHWRSVVESMDGLLGEGSEDER